MRLKVPGKKIAELHPADIAEIISDLTRAESGQLLETLDVKTVADTLEEVEPEFQASLVEAMSDEKVADVLEEMAPLTPQADGTRRLRRSPPPSQKTHAAS
jgi:Mg/Co/Ni transporter MgtE